MTDFDKLGDLLAQSPLTLLLLGILAVAVGYLYQQRGSGSKDANLSEGVLTAFKQLADRDRENSALVNRLLTVYMDAIEATRSGIAVLTTAVSELHGTLIEVQTMSDNIKSNTDAVETLAEQVKQLKGIVEEQADAIKRMETAQIALNYVINRIPPAEEKDTPTHA